MVCGSVDMDYETNENFDSRFYRVLSGGIGPGMLRNFAQL